MTMQAAVGELARVSVWSLRGLGYKFGIAERGASLVTWGEVLGCGILRRMRTDEAEIGAAIRETVRRTKEPGFGYVVDACGKHLFEIGLPAIDLATAAALQGTGRTLLERVRGLDLLPAVCAAARRDGFALLAVEATAPAAHRWTAVLPSARGGLLLRDMPTGSLLDLVAATADAGNLREDAAKLATRVEPGAVGFLAIPCRPADEAPARLNGAIRLAERWREANRHGLVVAAEDLRHLYDLEKRAWAPTSERSRSQAAF